MEARGDKSWRQGRLTHVGAIRTCYGNRVYPASLRASCPTSLVHGAHRIPPRALPRQEPRHGSLRDSADVPAVPTSHEPPHEVSGGEEPVDGLLVPVEDVRPPVYQWASHR